ncbi:MAG TPA: hypothetical protein VK604_05255 [Bryobacteraceae bacterium]|nr:hypothetical protein [Bryobacteraceae bacterium]
MLWLLAACQLSAEPPDRAIVPLLRKAPNVYHVRVWKRVAVDPKLDLVIAFGTPKEYEPGTADYFWWGPKQTLGLFLQSREQPAMVYQVALEAGRDDDCAARVQRATATDVVLSCTPEKGDDVTNRKFVYDIRAKALLKQTDYRQFPMARIIASGDSTVLAGTVFANNYQHQSVVVRYTPAASPPFGLLKHPEAQKWINLLDRPFKPVRFGPGASFTLVQESEAISLATRLAIREHTGKTAKPYPLPQTTYDVFAQTRPQSVKNGWTKQATTIDEEIGPTQTAGNTLWFGKTFYDGEGISGVGGFGYFDAEQRQYRIWSPPEVVNSSVTALLVEPEAVWLALAHRCEWGDSAGGLLRFDRTTENVTKIDLPDIANSILRIDGHLLIATRFGAAVVEDNSVRRFFVDKTTDGRLRVAEALLGKE